MSLLGIGFAVCLIGGILMTARTYDVKSSGCMIVVAGLLLLLAWVVVRFVL